MNFPRYLTKFESADGSSYSYTFPKNMYSLNMDQQLRTNQVLVAGASYPFDQLGLSPAPKSGGAASHALLIPGATGTAIDDELDDMRSNLYKAGLGKLFTDNENADDERWCWARLASMPATTWHVGDAATLNVTIPWLIVSDFVSSDAYDTDFTIDDSPKTVTVTNPGNARVYDSIFTLKDTFTNPTILNNTNGYQVATSRDGSSAAHWLEIRAGRPSVRFSTDSGVTYVGDFALVTLPLLQVQLMVLEPGDNEIIITGANGSTLNVAFDPPWE